MDDKAKHCERIKAYQKKNERIDLVVPKGTKERIEATGQPVATFIKELLFAELDKIEKYTK